MNTRGPNVTAVTRERDLLCFSHLRWNFVFQRPQHLMTRFARTRRVFYWEEPVHGEVERLRIEETAIGVAVLTPELSETLSAGERTVAQWRLLQAFLTEHAVREYDAWYYTPMALQFTDALSPVVTVFDCMDELSAFAFAPPELRELERELFKRADLVFTGGTSLYEAKRLQHGSVHLFPSSVDRAHFATARTSIAEPDDQQAIPRPRLGYFGVIDERIDIALIDDVAKRRPEWSIVMVGPVVKIDPQSLPRRTNIHYLGAKQYNDLPSYVAGWQIAMMPFARNDSTRFISPTKTPEYLAAGKPVISTPITDVVRPYGELGVVQIAENAEEFVREAEELLSGGDQATWLQNVDELLADKSWDRTWSGMAGLMTDAATSQTNETASEGATV